MNRNEVLQTAQEIINGDRRQAYGDVVTSFERIAVGWTAILADGLKDDWTVDPRDVALMMVWLKVVREANSHGDDNLVDIAGYSALAAELP